MEMEDKKVKLTFQGTVAAALVEKWGMVASVMDGEDSAGRAKPRLQTPDELCDRACDVAYALTETFRLLNWIQEES